MNRQRLDSPLVYETPYPAYRSNTDCRPDKTQQASHQASCTECYKIEITP